ncbi:ABC transporter permease [Sulfobacillus thermosulfidooxidans]|uniref:ABC transporter permease n=1 Tax=Sulfobacillus thermosulfidooxidans TaxID=28034 RepID=UPI0006B48218|nr:ABC transporter permease [Sulfobacillus thermosulfidooxidans]
MAQFLIRRFLLLIPVMFGVTVLIFLALHLAPGNPAQLLLGPMATPSQLHAITVQLGLNQPWPVQYSKWVIDLLRGNMGQSIQLHEAVTPLVFAKLKNTLILASGAFVLSSVVGISVGVIAGIKENSWIDVMANVASFTGLSVPVFWLGLVAILIFGLKLHWFPVTGMYALGTSGSLGQLLSHLVLPAATLAVAPGAVIAQLTRVAIIEERHQLYVRTAIAKGLSVNKAAVRHALRNAWIPIVTTLGLEVNYLIGGDVLVENIFNWPGIGQLLVQSVLARDYPTILGASVVLATIFVLVNFAIDAVYPLIDPRVKANG